MATKTSFTLHDRWYWDTTNLLEAGVTCTIHVDLPVDPSKILNPTHWDVYIQSETYGYSKVIAEKTSNKTLTFVIPESFYNEMDSGDSDLFQIHVDGYSKDPYADRWWSARYSVYNIYMKVPASYKPKLTLGTAVPYRNGYNGKFIAGFTEVKIPFTLSHNDSKDTIGFNDPICRYDSHGYMIDTDIKDGGFVTRVLDELEYDYNLEFYIKATDFRNRSVEQRKVITVYGYHLPSFEQRKSWISRCDASGKVDGLGGYAKLHLELTCSYIDGTNSIQSVVVKKGQDIINPIVGSVDSGILEYFMEIPIEESADLEITVADKISTNVITSFSIPQGTMPISLYDDGNGTGVAFGQMATKHGVWFHEPLIFRAMIDNKYKYFELTCNEFGMVMARQRISEVDKTCTVVIEPVGSDKDNVEGVFYLNNAVGLDVPIAQMAQGKSVTLRLNLGDILNFRYFYDAYYKNILRLYEDEVLLGEADEIWSQTSWNYVVKGDAHLCIADGTYTPARVRKIVNVIAQGVSSGYSLWDEGEVHHSLEDTLTYRVVSGETIRLNGTAVGMEIDYWQIGSRKYTTKELEYTVNSDVTIVAHFAQPIEKVEAHIDFSGGSYIGGITISDSNGSIYFEWWGRDNHVSQTIQLPKGVPLNFDLEMVNGYMCYLKINDQEYVEFEGSMSVTATLTGVTTIIGDLS